MTAAAPGEKYYKGRLYQGTPTSCGMVCAAMRTARRPSCSCAHSCADRCSENRV